MTLYHDLTEAQIAGCKQFDAQIWSDLHKDAYGSRPRFSLEGYTAEQLDALWVRTCKALEDTMDYESTMEIEAEIEFDRKLDSLVKLGAVNRNQAFRWLLDAEGMDLEEERAYQFGGVCYHFGLPFGMADELKELAR